MSFTPFVSLLFYFFWSIVSFVIVSTSLGSLDDLFKLGLSVLLYVVGVKYFRDVNLYKIVFFIFLSVILFQSAVTILQSWKSAPVGLFIEEGTIRYPYGKVASEDLNLYRPSGTLSAPTKLSRLLVMLLPFLLLEGSRFISKKKVVLASTLLLFASVFLSYTRVSWGTGILVLLFIAFWEGWIGRFSKLQRKYIYTSFIIIVLFSFLVFSRIIHRVETSTLSFDNFGSFDTRIKLISESINIIEQYPLFGVGLGNFVSVAKKENITGIYDHFGDPVHNLLLLITSEIGIPGVLFFIGFIVFSYKYYWLKRKYLLNKDMLYFKDAAALGGVVYLLETLLNVTFLESHFYLFILFMAILIS